MEEESDEATLAWIEGAAIENMKGKHATADTLAKEASVTLTVLLAAVGGTISYAVTGLPNGSITAWASLGTCIYLMGLAAWLVRDCMLVEPIPAIYNEPKNLLKHTTKPLASQRRAELTRLQARIDEAYERNEKVAGVLNNIRLSAVGTPVLFGACLLISFAVSSTT